MNSSIYFSAFDFIILPFYLVAIYLIANVVQKNSEIEKPHYRFYKKALFARIFSGIFFCIFYYYYYGGGDTTSYFMGGRAMYYLFFKSWDFFYYAMFNGTQGDTIYYFFDYAKGTPPTYMMHDNQTFFVIRFITPLMFVTFQSYVVTTVFMAWFAFTGVWKLYLVFYNYFPKYDKQLAFCILFFPSVLFWGSGIMKDTITLSAIGWYTYSVFMIFIKKEKIILNIVTLVIASLLLISTKPFIIIALLPGSMIWLLSLRIKNIKNKVMRIVVTPILIILFFWGGSAIMSSLSSDFGKYSSLESVLQTAAVTQQDLLRVEAYGSNSYNIGVFEPTLAGVAPKIPAALLAGLFRPFLWDSANFVMLISGIENTILLLLVFYCFFRVGIFKFFNIIFSEPLLLFSFLFSLFFAFTVGLASANFGALVRYKIPLLPFFASTIVVALNKVQEVYKHKKEGKESK